MNTINKQKKKQRVIILFSFLQDPLPKGEKPVSFAELLKKDKLYYHKSKPYTGKVQEYFENGQVKLEISYIKGKKDGLIIERYEDGIRKKATHYQNGKADGKETAWDRDGNEIGSVLYKAGKPIDGIKVSFLPGYEGYKIVNYKDGKKNGKAWTKIYGHNRYSGGYLKEEGQYLDDNKQGEWITRFSNVVIKDIRNYKNDIIQYQHFFDANGNPIGELNYRDGKPFNGIIIEWDEKNASFLKGVYANGLKHGTWLLWKNGHFQWQEKYKNGKKHGKWVKWKSKKSKLWEKNYKNDLPHGVWKEYGQKSYTWEEKRRYLRSWRGKIPSFIKSFKQYKNGVLHGRYYVKNDDGILIEEGIYKKGAHATKLTKYYGDSDVKKNDFGLIAFLLSKFKNVKPQKSYETFYNTENELHGLVRSWYRNGNIEHKGMYVFGLKDGTWKYFDEEGKLLRKEKWLSGRLTQSSDNKNTRENSFLITS